MSAASLPSDLSRAPRWLDRTYKGLAVYVTICALWMLTGLGGPHINRFLGLFADSPACLLAVVISAGVWRKLDKGPRRKAWLFLTAALSIYFIGTVISLSGWLRDHDPFPGPADIFYLAFYGAFLAGVLFLIRAATTKVPWVQVMLDATILMVGFGAFFWFFVIRPASQGGGVDIIKSTLSQCYMAFDCTLLLSVGVLLLTGYGESAGRRVPVLLLVGFAMMFIADVVWSVGKLTGVYLPGQIQDVLYVAFYVPLAGAARAELRYPQGQAAPRAGARDSLIQSLPYLAMLSAFLVLVYFARADLAGPSSVMTIIVFGLTLLMMGRQAAALRQDAAARERRAARVVEDRYASLIANASDVIMIVAADGALRFVSPAAERTLGLHADDLQGRNLTDLWHGADRERLGRFLRDVAQSTSGTIGPLELSIDRTTQRYVLEIVGSNLSNDPAVQGLALNLRDISERKALEEQLRQLAYHDSLTLLANRSLFRERVVHALQLAQHGRAVAVMFLDLDNFKNVNDSLGHDAGDLLLKSVASRLLQHVRGCDTVARLGGDEFAILVEALGAQSDVEAMAELLIQALDQPYTLLSMRVRVPVSIGLAFAEPDTSAEALLSKADIAMYNAKTAGKNRYVAFQPHMQEQLYERMRLEADLAAALQAGEFFLEYQPIIDLGSRSLLGVEALVRWRHPQLGILPPARFIPIAEDSGHIIDLGRWVLMHACQEIKAWRAAVAGGAQLRIAVNISSRQMQHAQLVEDVAHALESSGLEAGNLVLELTESTIMHNTDTNLERLRQLKALGVKLAIDDFGTGYSSLAYLHRFPIDILKIDRSFVGRLTNSQNGPELARAVIMLGETLGLDTVAEGIELEPQVGALIGLGCVAGQGFLFAKPGSLADIAASACVARRNALWSAHISDDEMSATGRFEALRHRRAGA